MGSVCDKTRESLCNFNDFITIYIYNKIINQILTQRGIADNILLIKGLYPFEKLVFVVGYGAPGLGPGVRSLES